MSFIVNDGGGVEVGPPEDDPIRRGHAQLVRLLALELEMSTQAVEAYDNLFTDLQRRVSELEQMVIGPVAAPVIAHPFWPPEGGRDACGECGHPEAVHVGWQTVSR